MTEIFKGKIRAILEFHQPTISISAEPMTQADTLNGVDWKGTFYFRALAYREYSVTKRRWEEWRDSQGSDLYPISIERRGGTWSFGQLLSHRRAGLGSGLLVSLPQSYTCGNMSSPPLDLK